MSPPQADKAGLHILLKLAALVIILAGIHAAADILVQLLLALFFAIVLNPLVTWFIRRGGAASVRHYPGGDGDAGDAHRAARRAGGVAQ
ncbi:PerM family permease [Klebsiella pneumoniae]|nr:PerM family permease [Klebsiella pneumoniae]